MSKTGGYIDKTQMDIKRGRQIDARRRKLADIKR